MSLRSFSLHDVVTRNAVLHANRLAFACDDTRVTHAQYAQRAAQLAGGLAAAGVAVGERVAVLAANCLEFADLFAACARLGAILVPINTRLSAEEVAYIVGDVAPRLLAVSPAHAALVPAQAPPTFVLGAAQGGWQPFASLYRDGAAVPAAAYGDDAGLLIIHTAAVGGRPRGALLSHRGLLAASMQAQLLWRLQPDDVHVGVLPMFHVASVGLMLATLHAGGATLVLPRFEPDSLVTHIDQAKGSLIGTFPPMLGALVDAAAKQQSKLASLRVATGIDVPDTIARFHSAHPQASFWAGYGQTETSGMASLAPFRDRPGSAGRPTALNMIAIVDDLDQPVPAGQHGEIVMRGPMVFEGYWNCAEDNALTFRNGWHHTGDLGRLDADGYLWFAGRSPTKELIKPGGENVYPAEVERALCEHPAIAEAVVFGVPDPQWGEAVKAVCVVRAGMSAPEAPVLIEFVGGRIARYKKPKHVVFVDALPRTAAGAIDRAAVKAAHP